MKANMFGSGAGYNQIQMLGLMNALKTGDPTTDTMIAMFLPIILTKLVNDLSGRGKGSHESWWSKINFLAKRMYKRKISYTDRADSTGNKDTNTKLDEDSYNSFLIKAIKLYIHDHCNFPPDDLDIELTDVRSKNSSAKKQEPLSSHPRRKFQQGQGTGVSMKGGNAPATSTFRMLQNCSIITRPVKNMWHNVGDYDGKPVHLYISESIAAGNPSAGQSSKSDQADSDVVQPHSVELRLKSEGPKSVDAFVETAYRWYLSELEKGQCDDRFFFDLKGFEGRGSHRYPVFGKYTLSDEKTFQSLFSRKCHELIKLIDQFQNKTGKYAIKGYPHKLGLLLHGPPGTGKTSLLKAVAHHTKRHIVNVPLSRIQTNADLMTLVFNQRYITAGQNINQTPKMNFNQVIFVFEDIDASSDVVKRRQSPQDSEDSAKNLQIKTIMPSQARVPPLPTNILTSRRQGGDAGPNDTNYNTNAMSPVLVEEDRLDLMGMLNVLDGVVDTPGRLVIMTSNFPEVLDPALIRPGRIDKILELGFMEAQDVAAMLEHYYETEILETGRRRVDVAINGAGEYSAPLKLIPARVEQLAMQEETIEAMLEWLENERCRIDGIDRSLKKKYSTVTSGTEDSYSVASELDEAGIQVT